MEIKLLVNGNLHGRKLIISMELTQDFLILISLTTLIYLSIFQISRDMVVIMNLLIIKDLDMI